MEMSSDFLHSALIFCAVFIFLFVYLGFNIIVKQKRNSETSNQMIDHIISQMTPESIEKLGFYVS